ncbi:MAG TPA: hypothetical protein VHJ17_21030 [Thermomonospora sp.]|nr:hypothetical protein [Thermomonospora sp.]
MGVDWVPARVRTEVDPGLLGRLIREQARLYAVLGFTSPLVDPPRTRPDDAEARARLTTVMTELEALCDISFTIGWRVLVIGGEPMFPPRWRDAAWSTFPPAAAAVALDRWRRWYEHCRAGRYRHYRHRLHTWNLAHELFRTQQALTEAAHATLREEAAWARKPGLLQARSEVFALPPPPHVPLPEPVPSPDEDRPLPDQEGWRRAVTAHARRVEETLRTFDRSVPGRHRRNGLGPDGPPLEEVVPEDAHLEEFFDQSGRYIQDGYGFYLW